MALEINGCFEIHGGRKRPVWADPCGGAEALVGCLTAGGGVQLPDGIGECGGPMTGCIKIDGGTARPVLVLDGYSDLDELVEDCCGGASSSEPSESEPSESEPSGSGTSGSEPSGSGSSGSEPSSEPSSGSESSSGSGPSSGSESSSGSEPSGSGSSGSEPSGSEPSEPSWPSVPLDMVDGDCCPDEFGGSMPMYAVLKISECPGSYGACRHGFYILSCSMLGGKCTCKWTGNFDKGECGIFQCSITLGNVKTSAGGGYYSGDLVSNCDINEPCKRSGSCIGNYGYGCKVEWKV